MPYIKPDNRAEVDEQLESLFGVLDSTNPGEMNYVITRILLEQFQVGYSDVSYAKINEIIGILECAKLEFYRRLAAPYENEKIEQNGDVYPE